MPGANPSASTTSTTRPWRCRACSALLGVERDGELHLKYKEVEYRVRGLCRHACRRCGTANTLLAPMRAVAPDPPLRLPLPSQEPR